MASLQLLDSYMVGHRHDDPNENIRLDNQSEKIKHGIMGGRLFHDSIPTDTTRASIADICCGTGAWLQELAEQVASTESSSLRLVGFDLNSNAFRSQSTSVIEFVQHDCTKPFSEEYWCKFDLVNMRGLAYAIPEADLPALLRNCLRLLKPGGHIQWLETESSLWKADTKSTQIESALQTIMMERRERQLVPYLPHFMLRELLKLEKSGVQDDMSINGRLDILFFELVPGGINRPNTDSASSINIALSDVIMESIQILLEGRVLRQAKQNSGQDAELAGQIANMKAIRKQGQLMIGGNFPLLIARLNAA